MKRLVVLVLILAACSDSGTDPAQFGPITLTASVEHEPPHTCVWQLTADAAELSDPATWLHGVIDYSDADPRTVEPRDEGLGDTIAPNAIQTTSPRGHGSSSGAWSARVEWVYRSAGATDTARVTFDCD